MGGFAAMTYKRGIHFIHIPTTLLAMVDASIGGKLGIDFHSIKNAVGLFAEPRAVFIYPDFIKTLGKRELLSGFAELIKHALIYDKSFWKYLTNVNFENIDWEAVVKKSLQIKKEIVSIDPFEKSLRKILNFGHSVGHAVESYFMETESPLKHGEAVAIGMICEAYISTKILGLKIEKLDTIRLYIRNYFDDVVIKEEYFPKILSFLEQDKKNFKGQFKFSLLKKIGKAEYDVEVNKEIILESLSYYIHENAKN
jgi:3-dehydroquinate synthase